MATDNLGKYSITCNKCEHKEFCVHKLKNRLCDYAIEMDSAYFNVDFDKATSYNCSLKDYSNVIHENAIEHGWWTEDRPFPEIVALCHSELSEALEASREGQPLFWYNGDKPDGIAIEMIDCVIRILDWFGHIGLNPEKLMMAKMYYNATREYKHGKRF